MNILLVTNTYTPHVGGVARSVESFAQEYRRRGHRVLVVAPEFEGMPESENGVLRVPAIVRFNGSDFSVPVPVPRGMAAAVEDFGTDVVHSHHPFLLGDTALRLAASRDLPVVFTHHTLYERYTHYVPGDSPTMKRFAVELAVGYCNLCDAVIAPSESIARLLRERGVAVPLRVIPTGVDRTRFAGGDGAAFRGRLGIPRQALVVGHVGRLAPEKNLSFLARAVGRFLVDRPEAHLLVVGGGPSGEELRRIFERFGAAERLHMAGVLAGDELVSAYRAMDLFAFASHTETQGMVLAEAMAAGVPVVAVDASGVREVVDDRSNGRLLATDDEEAFAEALGWVADRRGAEARALERAVAETARRFSLERTAGDALELYRSLQPARPSPKAVDTSAWAAARRRLAEEWRIFRNIAAAAGESVRRGGEGESLPRGEVAAPAGGRAPGREEP